MMKESWTMYGPWGVHQKKTVSRLCIACKYTRSVTQFVILILLLVLFQGREVLVDDVSLFMIYLCSKSGVSFDTP